MHPNKLKKAKVCQVDQCMYLVHHNPARDLETGDSERNNTKDKQFTHTIQLIREPGSESD